MTDYHFFLLWLLYWPLVPINTIGKASARADLLLWIIAGITIVGHWIWTLL